jgi:hypothetical protein
VDGEGEGEGDGVDVGVGVGVEFGSGDGELACAGPTTLRSYSAGTLRPLTSWTEVSTATL